MKLRFVPVASLPRLAWCVQIRRDEQTATVYHGPWVETRDDWFVEGAWDGDFAGGQFAAAPSFMGSGGQATADGLLLVTPCHPEERLYSIRFGQQLLISNSLVFVLVQAGDGPDLKHPGYYFDLLRITRRGVAGPFPSVRTRRGRRILLHVFCNLLVRPDLSVQRLAKNTLPPPEDYDAYLGQLQQGTTRIFTNAIDPRRRRRFRPIVSLSRGYDAPAAAVLAARAGCTRAVVFTRLDAKRPIPFDDGTSIALHLGMEPRDFGRFDFRSLPDCPEAEFLATPPGTRVPIAAMEAELAGSLLVTGDIGDAVWSLDPVMTLPHWQYPRANVGASTFVEFRLRAGIVVLPLPTISGINSTAIQRISKSESMKPWSVPGDYNRPIPRRIVEDAGIARSEFAQRKTANTHVWLSEIDDLTASGREDFLTYCATHDLPTQRHRSAAGKVVKIPGYVQIKVSNVIFKTPVRLVRLCMPFLCLPFRDRLSAHWGAPILYTFHWAVDRIKSRYMIPDAALADSGKDQAR